MLRRLLILLLVAGTALVAFRVRRFLNARALPRIPNEWRTHAERSAALTEALDVRERLARVVARDDRAFQRALLLDVHAVVGEVAELERLRGEVEALSGELPSSRSSDVQQAETRATLQARAERYGQDATQIVAGLHQVYLELLTTHEAGRGGGARAAQQTKALIDTLRSQASAEREISSFIEER